MITTAKHIYQSRHLWIWTCTGLNNPSKTINGSAYMRFPMESGARMRHYALRIGVSNYQPTAVHVIKLVVELTDSNQSW